MSLGGTLTSERTWDRSEGSDAFGDSFDSFYLREFPMMVAVAFAISGSSVAAEDIAQEAMVRAHRRWDQISQYDKPGAWVRRVTINLARSAFRRNALELRARLRLGRRLDPIPEPAAEDMRIWKAVSLLPPQQRAAVSFFYLEDRPVREIAGLLGCSEATAKVHLHKGRLALATALGHDPGKER